MLPKREITNKINWVLDNLLPPIVRDSPWLMRPVFKLVFQHNAGHFLNFKARAPFLDAEAYGRYYEQVADWFEERPTDLSTRCIERIVAEVVGETVLDAGCGRGHLAHRLAREGYRVVGLDLSVPSQPFDLENLSFRRGVIEALPFSDGAFDTVVCTHTLEHVQELEQAVQELRRVAGRRLIVVVPRQREYRYTFDLHLHFFPYAASLQKVMQNPHARITLVDGDFLYVEERPARSPAGPSSEDEG